MDKHSAKKSGLSTRDLTYIALFAVLMAVCAWISIPTVVPFTMQTFAVFAAVGLLGGRRGAYAVAVYLLLGAVGLPVFSGFMGGIGMLLNTTGGYLLGFLALALVYWAVTARLGAKPVWMALGMALGLLVCYAFGTAWFMVVYARSSAAVGVGTALGWCVVPFVVPDICKLALALGVTRALRHHVH